jgi:spore germination protein YaaH
LKNIKRLSCSIIILFLFITTIVPANADVNTDVIKFSDVPESSYAYKAINDLRALGVTNGNPDNTFGFGKPIKRSEFITFLVRLTGWEQVSPELGSFTDNQDKTKYYFNTIETALLHGVITKDSERFRPEEAITRDEMAVMIVRSLNYGTLAEKLDYLGQPFADINKNYGYITIAKDFGIINGDGVKFSPDATALKEQAAAMMMRMYDRLNAPLIDLNAFYAISSSSQQDKLTSLTSVSFGWSRLNYFPETGQIVLNTAHDGTKNEEYYIPEGFSERIKTARQNNIPAMLSVFASQDTKITDAQTNIPIGIVEYILSKPEVYRKVIDDVVSCVMLATRGNETESFDGVVIDFESMKGETLKQNFNTFLKELRKKLDENGKKLYVAVHPRISTNRSVSCFDGYDFKTIGSIADKVILMAHDYNAQSLTASDMARGVDITPLTPLEDIYYALKAVTDAKEGIEDKSKIILQISFDWVVWQKKDGKTINSTPKTYSYENFIKLLDVTNVNMQYSDLYRNPYIRYTDSLSGIDNTIWYEDTRSVLEKIKMADMFGIQGISLWRLGTIPDYMPSGGQTYYLDIWQNILKNLRRN